MDTPNNVQEDSPKRKAFEALSLSTDKKITSDEDFFAAVEEVAEQISEMASLISGSHEELTFSVKATNDIKLLIKEAREELDNIVTLYHS